MSADTKKAVYQIISEVFEIAPSDINDELDWREYDVESFALVELIIALQEEFNINYQTHELAKLHTVGEIVVMTNQKLSNV